MASANRPIGAKLAAAAAVVLLASGCATPELAKIGEASKEAAIAPAPAEAAGVAGLPTLPVASTAKPAAATPAAKKPPVAAELPTTPSPAPPAKAASAGKSPDRDKDKEKQKQKDKAEDKGSPRAQAELARLINEAEVALTENRLDAAESQFSAIIRVDPTNMAARMGMAEVHLAAGHDSIAVPLFTELSAVTELRARALQGKGIGLLRTGDRAGALAALSEAVKHDPGMWRAWNGLGFLHDLNREWGESEQAYRQALARNPPSAVVHNNYGYSLLMQQRYTEAAVQFRQALKTDPTFGPARANLRLAHAWQGDYTDAIAGAPQDEVGFALNDVGYIAMLRGDYDVAESYFLRAIQVSPAYLEKTRKNLDEVKTRKARQ